MPITKGSRAAHERSLKAVDARAVRGNTRKWSSSAQVQDSGDMAMPGDGKC